MEDSQITETEVDLEKL